MVVEFTIQSTSIIGTLPLLILVGLGAFLVILAFARGRRVRQRFVVLLVLGVLLIGLGVGLSFFTGASSTITVGNGYLYIKSSPFAGAGNMNITSSQIRNAYVGQIGEGNLTIAKQHGTNLGNYNIGVFTLGSGATAYVVSDNSTVLVVQMSAGSYVLVGTNDTGALVSAFSQYVHQVQGSTTS